MTVRRNPTLPYFLSFQVKITQTTEKGIAGSDFIFFLKPSNCQSKFGSLLNVRLDNETALIFELNVELTL